MRYHFNDFIALTEAVEREGGASLPDACVPEKFVLKQPVGGKQGGKMVTKDFHTAGCNQHARFVITYQEHEESKNPSGGLAAVCAVDDSMGLWPRYAGVVTEESFEGGPLCPLPKDLLG